MLDSHQLASFYLLSEQLIYRSLALLKEDYPLDVAIILCEYIVSLYTFQESLVHFKGPLKDGNVNTEEVVKALMNQCSQIELEIQHCGISLTLH